MHGFQRWEVLWLVATRKRARQTATRRVRGFSSSPSRALVLRLPAPALKTRINGWQEASSAFAIPFVRRTASAQSPLPQRPTRTTSRRYLHLPFRRCSHGGRRGRQGQGARGRCTRRRGRVDARCRRGWTRTCPRCVQPPSVPVPSLTSSMLCRSASVRRRLLQARVLGSAQGDGLCRQVVHLPFSRKLCTHLG